MRDEESELSIANLLAKLVKCNNLLVDWYILLFSDLHYCILFSSLVGLHLSHLGLETFRKFYLPHFNARI